MKKIVSVILSLMMMFTMLATLPAAGSVVKELGSDMVEWTEENEFAYDGEAHTRLVQVKDGETLLQEGVDYKLTYFAYNGEEFAPIEIMPVEIGEYSVTVTGFGTYQGEADNEFSIVADTANWGVKTENAGLLNYVDETGKTSAEIFKNEPVWLKEESGGPSAWYGMDNESTQQFRQGSRFWTRWLSPEDDKEAFEAYYNQLDEEHKNLAENNKLWIFLTGVTDPDGNEYTNLDNVVNYYVQLGDDWDNEEIGAVCINGDKDETLALTNLEDYPSPEGSGKFVALKMEHFSAYAVFEKSEPEVVEEADDTEITAAPEAPTVVAENTAVASPATGDSMTAALLTAVLAAGIGMAVLAKRKEEN